MDITLTTVQKIKISNIDALDPITVCAENYGPGEGKITIEYYDKAWTSYWGAMSDQSIEDFVISCDVDYIVKNLGHNDRNYYLCRIVKTVQEALVSLKEYQSSNEY